jgi:hypothetical protein
LREEAEFLRDQAAHERVGRFARIYRLLARSFDARARAIELRHRWLDDPID